MIDYVITGANTYTLARNFCPSSPVLLYHVTIYILGYFTFQTVVIYILHVYFIIYIWLNPPIIFLY